MIRSQASRDESLLLRMNSLFFLDLLCIKHLALSDAVRAELGGWLPGLLPGWLNNAAGLALAS